jgi:uncharacterized membrane protein AbrB (regulator of aidB expression)
MTTEISQADIIITIGLIILGLVIFIKLLPISFEKKEKIKMTILYIVIITIFISIISGAIRVTAKITF